MMLEPRPFICSCTRLVAPWPTAIMVMTAATPMMMPSMVRMLRSVLAARARNAERRAARKFMISRQPTAAGLTRIVWLRHVFHDVPIFEHDLAASPGGDVGLVRDDHHGHALLRSDRSATA